MWTILRGDSAALDALSSLQSVVVPATRLGSGSARDVFEQTLERVRRWYDFYSVGYLVMPEHAHLLVSEPERSSLAVALRMLVLLRPSRTEPFLLSNQPFRPVLAKGGAFKFFLTSAFHCGHDS